MPKVFFGTRNEPSLDLDVASDLIAVRTHSRHSLTQRSLVARPESQAVADGQLIAEFPEAGVEVYRVPLDRSLDDRKNALRASGDIRFAGSVLVHPATNNPVLYTENLYVRFQPTLDSDACEQILRDSGLAVKEAVDFATNGYFVAAPEGTGQQIFAIAEQLIQRPDVIYCQPELIEQRAVKQIFPEQWHLKSATINGVSVNAHVNLESAHTTTRGSGVTIAIIDDGVDINHPEFNLPGKVVAPYNATSQTNNPNPGFADHHGTACAGVACAAGINGASGVAPDSKLIPIRLVSGLGSMAETRAFRHAVDNGADVISCSWGPTDGKWFNPNDPRHNTSHPLPAATRDIFDYAITNGRGGKGCVILFAAGNGRESVDNDGYASAAQVIAVGACNDTSRRSVYSDFGNAVWCCFPSNDFEHTPFQQPKPLTNGIWTTDRTGDVGYSTGSYTDGFGGTSSACPGAAGIAALVLAVNPALTAAEVRDILKRCCVKIDPQGGQYNSNGHSPFYGYGRLDAAEAVKLAQASRGLLRIYRMLANSAIPDLGRVESTISVSETTPLQSFVAAIRLRHTYIGDLVITLIPPAGSGLPNVILHNREGGRRQNLDRQYSVSSTPGLAAYVGKAVNGTWTFRVEDVAAADSGTLEQIELQLGYGTALPAPGPAPQAAPAKTSTRRSR